MTTNIRDIAYQIRQGQLIALADETGWSVAADPTNDSAVEQLLTLRTVMPAELSPTVVIQNADQLGLYVAKLADIAYDLVEFSEIPLTVIYDQGKNVSTRLWPLATPPLLTGEIAVRRTLNADIQRLIGGFGRGLLTIPFESLTLPAQAAALTKERFGTLPAMPRKTRLMRLGVGGEVSFIRK
ncbi:L-threonylcarbamoyladenylate synthase [Spirosoma agri]|uniref:Sua5/YciO/YrdC/YwlC family protein n=1 Tax=Spirosoma agri TaxID=1987381 RepID=A0A6M0IGG1_9BACT|nr:Sua5/YciO/YrdC/YwlC family protein [Spirosoma agri]NEU67254.1 Sua5/YciO/YrdC/YwlC family protein [Spirosoma agri]